MVGREEPSGGSVDPDDWFAGTDVDSLEESRTVERAAAHEPAWVDDDAEEETRSPPGRLGGVSRRGVAALVASAIVLILAVLAASGVFSSGGSSSTTSPPTTTRQATTPTHTTASTTPTPAVVAVPNVVLKPGETGTDVKTLQRALANAGYPTGSIDGIYGPKTEQAVSAFQQSAAITVDGVYGPETKQALQRKVNSG
ncbi:MAG TPA: peptidoglycan-binding domain-containing protein [Gaiellaceae bacterium]|nr:peptidoglycan-binding domain-containing protein [Gaiellaceae bacterium]